MRRAIARVLNRSKGLADLCNHVIPGSTRNPSFVQTSNARLTGPPELLVSIPLKRMTIRLARVAGIEDRSLGEKEGR
ncbi:MAG: hypothetical protein DHS20C11_11160 [Lysobacteraceae bacterium]|nr:MAG: hypothetical protein DHS20C11_11160 [Xanthomonadaceae bacterium]